MNGTCGRRCGVDVRRDRTWRVICRWRYSVIIRGIRLLSHCIIRSGILCRGWRGSRIIRASLRMRKETRGTVTTSRKVSARNETCHFRRREVSKTSVFTHLHGGLRIIRRRAIGQCRHRGYAWVISIRSSGDRIVGFRRINHRILGVALLLCRYTIGCRLVLGIIEQLQDRSIRCVHFWPAMHRCKRRIGT